VCFLSSAIAVGMKFEGKKRSFVPADSKFFKNVATRFFLLEFFNESSIKMSSVRFLCRIYGAGEVA
jgi:hypothetical protein